MHERKLLRQIVQYWPLFPHVLFVLLVLWISASFPITCPLFAIASAAFYLYIVDSEQKKLLHARIGHTLREADYAHLHVHQGRGDTIETTWLNVLIRACWPAWEAGPVCRTLEASLGKVLEPKKVSLDRFRLGSTPPLVRSCTMWLPRSDEQHREGIARCDAALDMDLSFMAGDDMGVVLTVPIGYFGAKLFCDHLKIDCRLRLGLKFVTYFPYVSYLSVACLTVPKLGLSVRPLSSNGLAVTDLPMIASWVTNIIHMAIQTCGLVHPEKWEFDFIQWWGTDYGFGQTLSTTKGSYAILEILEARNLMAKDLSGFSDPYVIVTHGNQKFKTKTRKQTLNPSWHECFQLELASESSWAEKVLLRCRDRDLFIDDELGFYELDLKAYLNSNKRCEMLCKLESADSGELLIAITVVGGGDIQSNDATSSVAAAVGAASMGPSNEAFGQHYQVPPATRQMASQQANQVLLNGVVDLAVSPPCHRREGKDPEDANDKPGYRASGSADLSLDQEMATTVLGATSCVGSLERLETEETGTKVAPFPTEIFPNSTTRSLPSCSSGTQAENAVCGKDVGRSSVMPLTSCSSRKGSARSRKSATSDVKKVRRGTLSPLQNRRSMSFGNGRTSTNTSILSLSKSRLSLPIENTTLHQVDIASHSKTWKRSFFRFAFHRKKQKKAMQS